MSFEFFFENKNDLGILNKMVSLVQFLKIDRNA